MNKKKKENTETKKRKERMFVCLYVCVGMGGRIKDLRDKFEIEQKRKKKELIVNGVLVT